MILFFGIIGFVSSINITIASLTLHDSKSFSPLMSNLHLKIINSQFSRFFSHLFYSNRATNLNLHSTICSFFTKPVIFVLEDKEYHNEVFNRKKSNLNGGSISIEEASNITIDTCVFSQNYAQYYGGAISIVSLSANCIITNSSFYANTASQGGSIYCNIKSGKLIINESDFESNSAISSSDILSIVDTLSFNTCIFKNSHGCDMTINSLFGNCTIYNCSFFNNSGSIYFSDDTQNVSIESSCFSMYNNKTFFVYFETNEMKQNMRKISNCCFNATKENSLHGEVNLENNVFGDCESCYFVPFVPTQSPTLSPKEQQKRSMIVYIIICVFLLLAILSAVLLMKKHSNENEYVHMDPISA